MALASRGGGLSAASAAAKPGADHQHRAFGLGLAIILGIYLALATLYAVRTPAWQAPDEPAHYNYAAHIAATARLPVLQPGDYPAAYLEEIKARRFPPDMPIDAIRYEAHQPPAYYLLAAGLLRLAPSASLATRLLLVRLLSVALGACSLVIMALLARRLFHSVALALGATALAGSVPMFVAVTAAANNDALAFAALGLVALRLAAPARTRWMPRASIWLGALLGLCLLIKFQAYVAAPLVGGLWLYDLLVARDLPWQRAWRSAALLAATALLVASPWLARNISVYGWSDPLGLLRHDVIVVGQLRTGELLAEIGWPAYLLRYLRTTYQSFWGQFGWMAAPLPPRAYLVIGLLCLVALGGLAAFWRERATASPAVRRGVALLLLWALLTDASFLWYNLQFVQFQGRYLFPALAPVAVALACGLTAAISRPGLPVACVAALGGALGLAGLLRGDLPMTSLALCAAVIAGVLAASRLPARLHGWAAALAALGLNALTLYSLVAIIVPQLTP